MVMIARDEEQHVAECFASFWVHVDEVVLLDTGSRDDTIGAARRFAAQRDEPGKLIVGHFEWGDDFAAARAYADSLATGTWLLWCDLDDRVHGAHRLRDLAARAPAQLAGYVFDYRYLTDEHGNTVCRLRRERLVRAGHGQWHGRVHEAQEIDGQLAAVGPDVCEWRHRRVEQPTQRNLRILRAWARDEPDNPRVRSYLGTEELARGRPRRALAHLRASLRLDAGFDQERCQVRRKLSQALMALDRHDQAIDVALAAVRDCPSWPDSYLTLAEACYRTGDPAKAAHWARHTLALGVPDTALIVNPQDYVVAPRVVLAGALAQLGDLDQAVHVAEQALAITPEHPLLVGPYETWRARRKRDTTARTFCSMADLLAHHDEQLKALSVLEAVPHFAVDEPTVVAARSLLRERVTHPGDLVGEQPVPDDQVDELCDRLPRARFIAAQLTEAAA